jgi:RNA polymerase sigma factor (sigma-70 family)
LVAESLAGGREAFRQIVERHQTLVCSLAYSATGSLTLSEDLAQETFVSAWKQLAELREPSKLRAWLCGIARFVIGKELRRQGREPVHAAEALEGANELAAPEPLPSERAISKEEQGILWKCVAHIPEIYREPLVLFYREQQSIERVAEALELSPDTVKQRLARGRKFLREQVAAYVEGALQNTNPGKAFTTGVLAVLPLTATTAKAVTVGAAVKGSSAKVVTGVAAVGAMILFFSFLAFLAFVGGCVGYAMARACAGSLRQCENAIRFWRASGIAFAGCLGAWVIMQPLGLERHVRLTFYGGWAAWLDLFCIAVVAALSVWIRRWWRNLPAQETQEPGKTLKRRFAVWLSLGMIGPACLAVLFLCLMVNYMGGFVAEKHLSQPEVQKIITERKDAQFFVWLGSDTSEALHIFLRENGRRISYRAAADESTLTLLKENGVTPATASTSSKESWPFWCLVSFFIAPLGAVMLLPQIGKLQSGTAAPGVGEVLNQPSSNYGRMLLELRADPMARRVFGIAFAAVFLLVFSANALTGLGLYVVIVVGAVKGGFIGLLAGAGVLGLRAWRKAAKA